MDKKTYTWRFRHFKQSLKKHHVINAASRFIYFLHLSVSLSVCFPTCLAMRNNKYRYIKKKKKGKRENGNPAQTFLLIRNHPVNLYGNISQLITRVLWLNCRGLAYFHREGGFLWKVWSCQLHELKLTVHMGQKVFTRQTLNGS